MAYVGNIAEDLGLGLDVERLCAQIQNSFRRKKKLKYFEVNLENSILFVNEIIDREEQCEQSLLLFPFASGNRKPFGNIQG